MKLTPSQLEKTLERVIKINTLNQNSKNWKPVTFEIQGIHGLGKTSIVKKVATKLGLNFVKYNAAQISDAGDLTGRPTEEYECCLDHGDCIWITDKLVDSYKALGFEFTGNTRTGYAKPMWLTGLNESKGGILLLDDWTRAHGDVLQAVMELMLDQAYVSWSLPKGWTIILTSNPEKDEASGHHYNVTSTDKAQSTRYLSFELMFSIKDWVTEMAHWGLNDDIIAFASIHPEFVTGMSPRLFTIFGQMINEEVIRDREFLAFLASSTGYPTLAPAIEAYMTNERQNIIGIEDVFSPHITSAQVIKRIKEFTQPKGNRHADREYIFGVRMFNHLANNYTGEVSKSEQDRAAKRLGEILKAGVLEPDKLFALFQELSGSQRNHPELMSAYIEAVRLM